MATDLVSMLTPQGSQKIPSSLLPAPQMIYCLVDKTELIFAGSFYPSHGPFRLSAQLVQIIPVERTKCDHDACTNNSRFPIEENGLRQ